MATFELTPLQDAVLPPAGEEGVARGVLYENARWFTRIRWVVVGVLVLYGLANRLLPALLQQAGLIPSAGWPWGLAAILAVANLLFLLVLRSLSPTSPHRLVAGFIWTQIVVDLGVLTVLVHIVGPLDTFVSFAYLFHIVLACIFFAPRKSLRVALLSAALFSTTVVLETTDVLPSHSILVDGTQRTGNVGHALLGAFSAMFIWFVIWYLASTMSNTVRRRDRELSIANERLRQADKDKTLQVLRVTHDLKAPFSSIETNIQTLRYQHWDEVPQVVRDVITRIETRAATLRQRIKDILSLGELRTAHRKTSGIQAVALQPLLDNLVEEFEEKAHQQQVALSVTVPDLTVASDPRQLEALFANLVSNAIVYSKPGGSVEITVERDDDGTRVRVTDHGIGIPAEALPHVFEDYYRAKDAVGRNRQSTGLGLAIVRQVARNLNLAILVDTEPERGTTFEVCFPTKRSNANGQDTNH